MFRTLMAIALLMLVVTASGCAMCQNYADCLPNAYGGICGDGACGGGRVGSVIMPGGGMILSVDETEAASVSESEMPPREPVPAGFPAEAEASGPG